MSEQETRRSVLLSDIEGKEQRLRSLKPKIAALIKVCPVLSSFKFCLGRQTSPGHLGCPAVGLHVHRATHPLRPPPTRPDRPLCTVRGLQRYCQRQVPLAFCLFGDISDENIKISIVGTVEEAQKWVAQRRSLEEVESEDESKCSCPFRRTLPAPDGPPAPRTKRTVSSRLHSAKQSLIQAHPVYLSLDIHCEGIPLLLLPR